jgi:hypothetical protein
MLNVVLGLFFEYKAWYITFNILNNTVNYPAFYLFYNLIDILFGTLY